MTKVDYKLYSTILPTLYAAHTIGDHIVQTDHQAMNKPYNWKAMIGHIGGYQVTQTIAVCTVLYLTGLKSDAKNLIIGSLLSAITHAFIDRRWPVVKMLEISGSKGFSKLQTPLNGPYLADQALHTGILMIVAAVMSKGGNQWDSA